MKVLLLVASIYWPGDGVVKRHDLHTSSGARLNVGALTCAHKTLAFGTRLKLAYGGNNAVVTINDRGPFKRGRDLDCTPAVAKALRFPGLGHVHAELQ